MQNAFQRLWASTAATATGSSTNALSPSATTTASTTATSFSSPLRVVSYNIWFDHTHLIPRTEYIVTMLREINADVVCLQEVTHESLRILQPLKNIYDFSPVPEMHSYFTMMLVRKALCVKFGVQRFPSEMGRQLVVGLLSTSRLLTLQKQQQQSSTSGGPGDCNTPSAAAAATSGGDVDDLVVATSHFESMSSRPLRKTQLEITSKLLQRYPRWVLCGDFNFCSYRNFGNRQPNDLENQVLAEVLPPHVDMWLALHPFAYTSELERGYTFDSECNPNLSTHAEQMRYDRIIISSPSMAAAAMKIIGMETIPVDAPTDELFVELKLPSRPQKADHQRIGSGDGSLPAASFVSPPSSSKTTTFSASDHMMVTPDRSTKAITYVCPSDHFGLCGDISVML